MSLSKKKFSSPVINELKFYVYIYSNPITNEIFYVGKGKGNRAFSHLNDKSETNKVAYIQELKNMGLKPNVEILIHGLEDEKTALRVESSIIDLIGINNLTNKQGGYKSATYGRMTLDQINSAYDKRSIEVIDPSIAIRINREFQYSMTPGELYDITRAHWKINPKRAKNALYAFAVYGGIIQEVYKIVNWYKACTTYISRQGSDRIIRKPNDKLDGRFEFIGNIAEDNIRSKYKYRSIEHYFKKGNMNPIFYFNV